MLEKLPAGIGRALRNARPGLEKLAFHDEALLEVPHTIELASPDFSEGGSLPARCTADGEGVSPALRWHGVPETAVSLVLLIEDADSPTPRPLVHAIVWDIPAGDGELREDALATGGGARPALGRNSYLTTKYLPPDPPRGHGAHRYAFQLFALRARPDFDGPPGRGAIIDVLGAEAIAKGLLIGVYERR